MFLLTIFYVINRCIIYNCADDNTLSVTHSNQTVLATMLQGKAEEAIDWFSNNTMAANPDKFQAILLAPSVQDTLIKPTNIKYSTITTTHSVNILGIEIDDKLKFNTHINSMSQGGSPTNYALFLTISQVLASFKNYFEHGEDVTVPFVPAIVQ